MLKNKNMSKQKGFSTMLVVIVVLVVITGGVLVWQYLPGESVDEGQIETEQSVVDEETANWQTYRNEELGFEVEYPRIWPLPQQLAFHSEDYQWQEMGKVVRRREITAGVKVDISFAKIPENIEWREWTTLGRGAVGDVVSSEFATIGDREIYRIVMEGSKTEDIAGRNYIEVRFTDPIQEQEVIFILYSLTEDREKNEEIFNQMLSTFKFID